MAESDFLAAFEHCVVSSALADGEPLGWPPSLCSAATALKASRQAGVVLADMHWGDSRRRAAHAGPQRPLRGSRRGAWMQRRGGSGRPTTRPCCASCVCVCVPQAAVAAHWESVFCHVWAETLRRRMWECPQWATASAQPRGHGSRLGGLSCRARRCRRWRSRRARGSPAAAVETDGRLWGVMGPTHVGGVCAHWRTLHVHFGVGGRGVSGAGAGGHRLLLVGPPPQLRGVPAAPFVRWAWQELVAKPASVLPIPLLGAGASTSAGLPRRRVAAAKSAPAIAWVAVLRILDGVFATGATRAWGISFGDAWPGYASFAVVGDLLPLRGPCAVGGERKWPFAGAQRCSVWAGGGEARQFLVARWLGKQAVRTPSGRGQAGGSVAHCHCRRWVGGRPLRGH